MTASSFPVGSASRCSSVVGVCAPTGIAAAAATTARKSRRVDALIASTVTPEMILLTFGQLYVRRLLFAVAQIFHPDHLADFAGAQGKGEVIDIVHRLVAEGDHYVSCLQPRRLGRRS